MLVGQPEQALHAHALFNPADRLNGRLQDGWNGSGKTPVSSASAIRLRRAKMLSVSGGLMR